MISKEGIKKLKTFLLDNNIDNERIINKASLFTTNLALGKFKSDLNNKLLLIKKIASENQSDLESISPEINEILSKIDILSNKEIKEKILLKLNFENYKNKCIEVLENENIDRIKINAIISSSNYDQIDKILNEFPFTFLKDNNLLYKKIKEDDWFSKKSVRHINTRM